MFSRARAVKTLPGMHCDHLPRTFLELVTRMFKHKSGQQVPEHGYCHLVAGAATQPNPETPAGAPERVLFSF